MDAEGVQAIRGAHAQQQESGIARGDSQANDLAQRREAEETRRDILATLLEPAARERCEYIPLSSNAGRFCCRAHMRAAPLC